MGDMERAKEIAGTLTKAQREFVLEMSGTAWPGYKPLQACIRHELVEVRPGTYGDYLHWLPLSAAVRRILEDQNNAQQ